MESLTISPKYQVVILEAIRKAMHLAPGQKVQIIAYDNRIELIPERAMGDMRGFLEGIETEVGWDKDRV